jgi:triosephosphate isomerase
MRKKIAAANWKMNTLQSEGKTLVANLLSTLPALSESRQVVIAPPFTQLVSVSAQLQGHAHIYASAQNCATEKSGAYTGEISATMVKDSGASYVIVGHSERREYYKEDNATLVKKSDIALENGLKVIFCCGEPLSIRDAETQNQYVEKQIREGLFHYSTEQLKNIVIAYEPIWAIGTGRTASAQQAQDMHAYIRSVIAGKFGTEAADDISILYGGSVKASNAAELFSCPDVDGGLVGGASLVAEEFTGIITAMVNS